MTEYKIGMLVRSKAGRDKGKLYIVSNISGDFLELVDGKLRPLSKPKRKRKMHVQVKNQIPEIILERMVKTNAINNEDIQHVIGG